MKPRRLVLEVQAGSELRVRFDKRQVEEVFGRAVLRLEKWE